VLPDPQGGIITCDAGKDQTLGSITDFIIACEKDRSMIDGLKFTRFPSFLDIFSGFE
jgi:hypothetical protein